MYLESEYKRTLHFSFKEFNPAITPLNSIRLFVVFLYPFEIVFSMPLYFNMTPNPPGPGFPEQAPSVNISTTFILF